jgi:two-component system, chemotaxis family, CheB/CheR fusion protein
MVVAQFWGFLPFQETAMTVAPGRKDRGDAGESEGTHFPEKSESAQARSVERAWFDEFVELLDPPAVVLDRSHRIFSANNRFCELSETNRESLIGRHIRDAVDGVLNVPAVQEALADFASEDISRKQHKLRIDLYLPGRRNLAATMRSVPPIFRWAKALLVAEHPREQRPLRSRELVRATSSDPQAPLSIETLHHDLRQPLQTLSLLQGLLASKEVDPALRKHIVQLSAALEAVGGMLNVLDDIERPRTKVTAPFFMDFPIGSLLSRLRSEFSYHADARGFSLSVVPSGAVVHSDPRLLEQTIRALLLAATKMIKRGKVLLGCRRQSDKVSIQVWIDGEVIPSDQQQAILEQFQFGAKPAERGVVHSIVKPFAALLGLSVKARSRLGTGLAFTAEVPTRPISQANVTHGVAGIEKASARGTVAVASDNPLDREALTLLLKENGYEAVSVVYDADKVRLEAPGTMQPELIVGHFSRSAARAARRIVEELRRQLGPRTPVILMAGESWRAAQSSAIGQPVIYLSKPVTAEEITAQVAQSLATARRHLATPRARKRVAPFQTTFVVDDDRLLLEGLSSLLRSRGEQVEVFQSGESFLENYTPVRRGCLVVDDKLPGLRGIELLERLKAEGATLPAIMITGHGDVSIAVRAMKAGAIDYLEKPLFHERLLSAIEYALDLDRGSAEALAHRQQLVARVAALTQRERQVMDLVVKGASSKSIARILNISQRTVETHRAAVMKRTGARSLPELIRIVMQLGPSEDH